MTEPALRDRTTLRLGGGPARRWVTATTETELVEAVRAADDAGEPVLVLGGGSNLVVADEGFAGTVVEVATRGIRSDVEDDDPTCGGAMVTVAAGESWDAFVATAVERGTPLADVLHAQAADDREAGRRELIESAARREVLMMVPVVFLVLPVTILFAFSPLRAGREGSILPGPSCCGGWSYSMDT